MEGDIRLLNAATLLVIDKAEALDSLQDNIRILLHPHRGIPFHCT